jgi:nicotinamidase-related amidase
MKAAILIIDVLQDFFNEGRLKDHRSQLTSNINSLTEFARTNQTPVIWVRQEFKDDLSDAFMTMRKKNIKKTIENTPGCQLLPELVVDPTDKEVIKKRYSAFYNTNLEGMLKELQIDTLVVAGINTHACIRMAAIDAYQRDLELIIATDCIDSWSEKFQEATLEYITESISIAMNNSELFEKL